MDEKKLNKNGTELSDEEMNKAAGGVKTPDQISRAKEYSVPENRQSQQFQTNRQSQQFQTSRSVQKDDKR